MQARDIARSGLKGRKRDTLLLKIVITLAFIFIITATIYQSSTDETKSQQRYDLYGEWNGAYLQVNEDKINQFLANEKVDSYAKTSLLGEANVGYLGSYQEELSELGRLSLYKGNYPQNSNEIMVELNQMSQMGLDLKVGQKVSVVLDIELVNEDLSQYIFDQRNRYLEEIGEEEYIEFRSNKYHETPFEQINDITLVASSDYFYYYVFGEVSDPETIRNNGFLQYQKITIKKDFIVSGILNTYSDKWDLGGYTTPNAFITEEATKEILDVFYNNNIVKTSNYEFKSNIFFHLPTLANFNSLREQYKDNTLYTNNYRSEYDIYFWEYISTYGQDIYEKVLQAIDRGENWEIFINPDYDPTVVQTEAAPDTDVIVGTDEETAAIVATVDTSNFRRNTFSYPVLEGSTEYIFTIAIIAVVFLATACAVFQIFITQMKRRTRKIVLLKSIGATNGQIVKIILWEGLYLLRSGLLFGISIGLLLSYLSILILNSAKGSSLIFSISYPLLLLGILLGCVALFVGMIVPMIFAVRIPLLGTMSKPPKHKKQIKHKDTIRYKRQSLGTISLQYFKLNIGKSLLPFGLSILISTILLTTLFLGFYSFKNYINTVVIKNRPDYAMEGFYGEMPKYIDTINEELAQIDGVTSISNYKVGKHLFLWYDGIDENEVLNRFKERLPSELLNRHFSKYNDSLANEPDWIKNAFYTNIYGIEVTDPLYDKLIDTVTLGEINKEEFEKGNEVILLVPLTLPGARLEDTKKYSQEELLSATNDDNRLSWLLEHSETYHFSYNKALRDYYNMDSNIKVGDMLHLSSDDEKIVGEEKVISHTTKEVKVGGIIYYFNEEGVWPFSDNQTPYTVIGSIGGMEAIYPNSKLGLFRLSKEQMKNMVATLYPYRYGRTIWYLDTDTEEYTVLDSKLLAYANNLDFKLYNYRESNLALWQEALNNCIIIILLGLTSALIGFIILYNTLLSKVEQEQNRIGILQSMGVTHEKFNKHYILVGVAYASSAFLISNLIIFIVVCITSIGSLDGLSLTFLEYMNYIFNYTLYLYPWFEHLLISILLFIVIVFMNYRAGKKITSKYPIENIRSLNR